MSTGCYDGRLLGLFEIDGNGKVLYSSFELPDGSLTRLPNTDGTNFFKTILAFNNAADFQRRFEIFRIDEARSSSFQFTCQYADGPHSVRIVMARLVTGLGPPSFLIHFRKL